MNRKTINSAADKFAEEKTSFRKDVLKEVDADNYELRRENSAEDFIAGAQWRINSVWHDSSVRPSDDCDVLVETTRRIESDRYDADYNELDSGTDWETEVIRWAYIDDLLPERKEEQL